MGLLPVIFTVICTDKILGWSLFQARGGGKTGISHHSSISVKCELSPTRGEACPHYLPIKEPGQTPLFGLAIQLLHENGEVFNPLLLSHRPTERDHHLYSERPGKNDVLRVRDNIIV